MSNILKHNPHVLHFLGDRVCPKGVTVLLVESVSFCNRSRHLDPKLMRFLEEAGAPLFHQRNNVFALAQHMMDPPVEGWLIINPLRYRILSDGNGVCFL
jgi:hypothetical protein